ncbi:MAG: WYL domain-containing protein [Bacteroidia bacterium]
MSKREATLRHHLIIKKVRKNPATFDEIADYLSRESELQEYVFNTSKRTFQRDLEDILSTYNIEIKYDFSQKKYFINEEDQTEVNDRMLEAFDMFNALNVSDRLSKHIHFEKRKPQGTENLYGLLHAIKNNFQIKFSYQKYWDEEIEIRKTEPYALKEFKNRWYLMAKDLKDEQIKSFALDRLSNLEITKTKFLYPKEFNLEENYKYCFGIISPDDGNVEEIILSFNPLQGKYIKSLPLHETQQIIEDTKKELRIKLKLYITFDFIMELLSYGEDVKVIQPKSLIKGIKSSHQKAVNRYK